MTLPGSSEPEMVGTDKSLLSFLAYIVILIGAYCVLRKSLGIIPALISVYLLYVYRDDVGDSIKELIHNGRT
jgi:hypothetical protein